MASKVESVKDEGIESLEELNPELEFESEDDLVNRELSDLDE